MPRGFEQTFREMLQLRSRLAVNCLSAVSLLGEIPRGVKSDEIEEIKALREVFETALEVLKPRKLIPTVDPPSGESVTPTSAPREVSDLAEVSGASPQSEPPTWGEVCGER